MTIGTPALDGRSVTFCTARRDRADGQAFRQTPVKTRGKGRFETVLLVYRG